MNKFFISFTYRKWFGVMGTGAISGTYEEGVKQLSKSTLSEIILYIKKTVPKTNKIVPIFWKEWE